MTNYPEMVAIPGGTFLMGSPDGEGYEDEFPQHEVKVPPFSMGRYLITQGEWKAVASQTELKAKIDLDPDPSNFNGASRPVEGVSWYDAVEFCARLSKLTGKLYRLPSEAEWEHACRAGTTTPFYFGKDRTKLGDYAWCRENSEYSTHPVGMKKPNAFGLYDMYGQVWEWCEDTWHDKYEGAPTDGSTWLEGKNKSRSPLRGGSWGGGVDSCRSGCRDYGYKRDSQFNHKGFRVVCDVQQKSNENSA